ncbi:MAG: 3-phosphoshikimate 1-carboxyvinyltransferase [Chloroflexi bacterium]|uniref:3-phosphoshikimate 1-carboxyvinyltransferase n=1 Tax=Candidatus Chlorohelix allophototropha TaxID=3003348 RepID=A0A8T7LUR9_9CHLR|nr:3-phosphoshikimate 1-carboxyvinyltransferase [Chloroflexota bacterium]WJW66496.1 3-phosphoshikimate 1-carboxyvinyltransferase [Chloroflexota bacterium L227-S17]
MSRNQAVLEAIDQHRIKLRGAAQLRGELTVPGDKSISHRSVIFNAIASGEAFITNFLPGEDCLSSIECMRAMGVEIELDDTARTVRVKGKSIRGLTESAEVLNAGNSGTTTRLLTGLLSGQNFYSVITGDSSLRSRPMGRVINPMRQMGAQIWGRKGDTLAPLSIKGTTLKGINYSLPVASAQLKSAILLAALYAEGETHLSGLIDSRDHTERMLKAMGAPLLVSAEELVMKGPATELIAQNVSVPGDISSAAFWLVAASVHPDADLTLKNVGVNPTRTGIIDVLGEMGANITLINEREVAGEPVADIRVVSAELRGTSVSGNLIPRLVDEIPALAVAAILARSNTCISDAAELRVKETDRIATICSELGQLGAILEAHPDGMTIQAGAKLRGATVQSHGDHRMAMSLAIAGLLLPEGEELEIADYRCADVSYPGFWSDLEKIIII